MSEKHISYPISFIKKLSASCKALSEGAPRWLRPFLNILLMLMFTILSILFLPFEIIRSFVKKKTISPFFMLRTEIETKWSEGNKNKALEELRKVANTLREHQFDSFLPGYRIEPYGKFTWEEYSKVLWLLYHWEFQYGNYAEAKAICEEVLDEKISDKMKGNKYYEQWIVNKARVLVKTANVVKAREYLLKYIDPNKDDSIINKYFEDIKDT